MVAYGQLDATDRRSTDPRSASTISTGSPGGLYLTALSSRFAHGALQAGGHAGDERRLQLEQQRSGGGVPARAFGDIAHEHVQAQVLGVGAGLLAAGEFDQVVHQQRQLADLLDDVGQQALAFVDLHVLRLLEDLDVRAQAGDGRAQLVRGVGDQLALGVDGRVERAHRVLERVEHRVEADRQAPDLVFSRRTRSGR